MLGCRREDALGEVSAIAAQSTDSILKAAAPTLSCDSAQIMVRMYCG